MLTKTFWFGEGGVFVRAVRTWAQTAVAAIGVGTTNLFSADIKNVLALASSAAILSILMSLDRNTAGSTTVVVESAAAVVPAPQLQSSYTGDVR